VEVDELVHLDLGLCPRSFQRREQLLLGLELLVARHKVLPHGDLVDEEVAQLLPVDRLEVSDGDLSMAIPADVLRRVRGHRHLAPAIAEDEPSKQMSRPLGRLLAVLPTPKDCVALLPQFLGNDRLDGNDDPLGLRLQFPRLPVARRFRVVRSAFALRGWVFDEAPDRGVRPA
jgi:hypothetical protein